MWFTENPWPPMLIAAIAATVCLGIWNTERRNLYFFMALAFLAMTGGIYAVERAIVTEGERLQNSVMEMCDQFRRRDPRTLDHFSEQTPEWKDLCKSAMELVQIQNDLRLTDFATTITNNSSRARVHFRANATISALGATAYHPFRCVLTFQKEGGLWKIIQVERLDPLNGERMQVMEPR
jgi:hypothetical protein